MTQEINTYRREAGRDHLPNHHGPKRVSAKKKYMLWKRVELTGRNKEYKEYKKQISDHDKKRKNAKRRYEKEIVKKAKTSQKCSIVI